MSADNELAAAARAVLLHMNCTLKKHACEEIGEAFERLDAALANYDAGKADIKHRRFCPECERYWLDKEAGGAS